MSTVAMEHSEKIEPPPIDRQVVALHLGDEIYGIDISIIHTVITPQAITSVPKTPPFIKGVMNLRGRILPVIDLRARFDLPPMDEETAKSHRIVIVDTEGISAGLIVDAVSEVLRLPLNMIDPPSGLIASNRGDFITGIGRIPKESSKDGKTEQLILLMDAHKAMTFNPKDVEHLKKLQKAA